MPEVYETDAELWEEAFPQMFPDGFDGCTEQPSWPTEEILIWFAKRARAIDAKPGFQGNMQFWSFASTSYRSARYSDLGHWESVAVHKGRFHGRPKNNGLRISAAGLQRMATLLGPLNDPAMQLPTRLEELTN